MKVRISTDSVEVSGRVKPKDLEKYVTFSAALFAAKMGVLIEHNKNVAGAINALGDAAKIMRGDADA